MIRERLDSYCEKGVLALVLAVLVFGPLVTGAVRPFEFLIIQGLTIAAVLLWMLRFWLNPGHRLLWPPICWAVIAFVLYAIARYQRAEIEYVARQELIRVLVYTLLFFLVLNNLAHQESAQLVTLVMVFLGMVISMFAIYQFATNSEYVWHFIKPAVFRKRGSGTYINPNDLAGFLEMLVPLGLAYTRVFGLCLGGHADRNWRDAFPGRLGRHRRGTGPLFRFADSAARVSDPGTDCFGGIDRREFLLLFKSRPRSEAPPQRRFDHVTRQYANPIVALGTDAPNVEGSSVVWRGASAFRLSFSPVQAGGSSRPGRLRS